MADMTDLAETDARASRKDGKTTDQDKNRHEADALQP